MRVDKILSKQAKKNLSSVDNTVSLRNFYPVVDKRLNSLFFITLLLVMNLVAYKLISKNLKDNQKLEISILKQEIAALKNSNQVDIVLLNKINTLNESNRNDLLKVLKSRIDRSLGQIRDEKTEVKNLKKQIDFDFDKYLKDKSSNKLITYNDANYNTLFEKHTLIERRIKERNNELKEAFISGHDLKKIENMETFKKLQDKLHIDHYAVVQKNRMKRREFRKKKFTFAE